MSDLSSVIKYLSACYKADNRETGLLNFFGSKVEKGKILGDAGELLNGDMPFLPLSNNKYSEESQKIIQLYKKEKEFFLGALFVVGKSSNQSLSSVCAPLLMYPASISEKEYLDESKGYTITYTRDKVRINLPVLREILKDNNTENLEDFANKIEGGNLNFTAISNIKSLLDKYTIANTENLLLFPKLFGSRKLKNELKNLEDKEGSYVILPVCSIGIITKSTETRGVINELEALSQLNNYSKSIEAIYGQKQANTKEETKGLVPAVLSSAQTKVLNSVSDYPYTVIVGPPGTGKTFTISSLAIEQISKGKSVLIVSRTDEAVDVVEKKIKADLNIENVTLRAGKRDHLKQMKKHIQNLIKGMYDEDLKITESLIGQKNEIRNLEKKINKLEKVLQKRIFKNIERSNYLFYKQHQNNLLINFKKQYLNYSQSKRQLLNSVMDLYEETLSAYQNRISQYISDRFKNQVSKVLDKNRLDLIVFLNSIKARTGSRQEYLQAQFNYEVLLKTFPIWLTRISDISRVLPMKKELFDLVIVDEATQCDMASLLPVFQRAKKVVLAGDPNQLKHISFLSNSKQFALSKQICGNDALYNNFNYRNDSMLNYAILKLEEHNQIAFLNEHFRSVSSIIAFSNKHFYDEKLLVMTQKPSELSDEGVKIINTTGNRDKKGINKKEIEHLIETLRLKIDSQKELSKTLCDTIGVLSPFRAQVEELSKQIMKNFNIDEIEKHELMTGTAYSFQGQERDIMLLSMALDNNSHHSAFIHCNKADVFNVSITRAKKKQVVFHSLDHTSINTKYLIRNFLERYTSKKYFTSTHTTSVDEKDKFLLEINTELKNSGYNTWPGFFIAGQVVDILVQKGDKYFGIDLIGFPGQYEAAFTLERYKMLKRASLEVFPVSYIDWLTRKEMCLEAIDGLD